MARIDSLLAIVVDQGASELRVGSDREPKMFAQGVPKKLHLPPMPEQTIRGFLGDILSPERAAALETKKPVEVVHDAGPLGSFHVTMTAREGGGLDVLFLRDGKRGAPPPAKAQPAAPEAPPALMAPAVAAPTSALPVEAEPRRHARTTRPSRSGSPEALVSLVARAAEAGASDLHLLDGEPPAMRTAGALSTLDDFGSRASTSPRR